MVARQALVAKAAAGGEAALVEGAGFGGGGCPRLPLVVEVALEVEAASGGIGPLGGVGCP